MLCIAKNANSDGLWAKIIKGQNSLALFFWVYRELVERLNSRENGGLERAKRSEALLLGNEILTKNIKKVE